MKRRINSSISQRLLLRRWPSWQWFIVLYCASAMFIATIVYALRWLLLP